MFPAIRTLMFPSILSAGFLALAVQQSSAAAPAAAQATEMLARAHAIQQKCKFLSSGQNDALSNLVVKAEMAMGAQSSSALAKSIIANGRAQGRKAACSNAERADIVDILNAAHQAIASNANIKSKSVITNKRVITRTASIAPTIEPKPKRESSGQLAQYQQLTKRYYLARRCNTMSFGAINGLYRTVVSTHRNVVSTFGVPAVRKVMQQSEQQANWSSCS